MVELFWLLLPVAALSGWIIGRRGRNTRGSGSSEGLQDAYFQGLNYLLNEQPDKAIEVFTRMVEVDADTVETHFALGSLFRRRGEVDRAIRIHQNLIARPSLTREQRIQALLALGEDYLKAGLLDRAENLFEEVVQADAHVEPALSHLLDVYQQEKEWTKAISAAARLESRSGQPMATMIAQFYCEQVEAALASGERNRARNLLKRALTSDPSCVRASLLQGQLERYAGNYKQALKAYQRVRYQDVEYLPEVLEPMEACYRELGRPQDYLAYLQAVQQDYHGASLLLALAEQIRLRDGDQAAADYLEQQLRQRPSVRGLTRLLQLNLAGDVLEAPAQNQPLPVLQELFETLLKSKPSYACGRCGFTARTLHWHCPSCRSWSTIKPIHGVEGE
ncbi:MAG: lipopolysaccharide assembly protein LapB [Ectothiorhodospiraceae bacterium]|nr:lipopolysaccharide assembly protein LapB [Ectothiorhodospiraceae bacterium]